MTASARRLRRAGMRAMLAQAHAGFAWLWDRRVIQN
jgi:hypothetical protein